MTVKNIDREICQLAAFRDFTRVMMVNGDDDNNEKLAFFLHPFKSVLVQNIAMNGCVIKERKRNKRSHFWIYIIS